MPVVSAVRRTLFLFLPVMFAASGRKFCVLAQDLRRCSLACARGERLRAPWCVSRRKRHGGLAAQSTPFGSSFAHRPTGEPEMDRNELKHIGAWLAVPLMAVGNGALRDLVYGRKMSDTLAHSLSVLPLLPVILAWAWLLARRSPLAGHPAGLRVGLIWLLLTLMFEFGLGALRGLELRAMLEQYDITQGHLWPLVPITMGVSPELAADCGAAHGAQGSRCLSPKAGGLAREPEPGPWEALISCDATRSVGPTYTSFAVNTRSRAVGRRP